MSRQQISISSSSELTVSQISQQLKRLVDQNFSHVRIRGEISGLKQHTSGHVYFTLKDSGAVLDAVCWRGTYAKLTNHPQDGMEVVCVGRLTTYAGRSKYQIVVEAMEFAGVGALLKLLEERKQKLHAEGLFAQERKRPIPFLPQSIGVITSPTGAVLRDIRHRLEDRFPRPVLLWPVLVQGNGAAEQIAQAIQGFNYLSTDGPTSRPDVLILARGGGSVEDLWAFNEEIVVRAIAASEIPVISGVGHETDTTLVDYVADRRAPTPTAAAEMAVPVYQDLVLSLRRYTQRLETGVRRTLEYNLQRVDDWGGRLIQASRKRLEFQRMTLVHLQSRLRPSRDVLATREMRLNTLLARLNAAAGITLQQKKTRLETLGLLLESYSYTAVLKRGFALVKDDKGQVVTRAQNLKSEMPIQVTFHDGDVKARVEYTHEK
ncbi:MAG: exodeoxyribonuclease VII large subunit [Pseudomonadota bacterium]